MKDFRELVRRDLNCIKNVMISRSAPIKQEIVVMNDELTSEIDKMLNDGACDSDHLDLTSLIKT